MGASLAGEPLFLAPGIPTFFTACFLCGLTVYLHSNKCIRVEHKARLPKNQLGGLLYSAQYFVISCISLMRFECQLCRTNVRAISGAVKVRDSPLCKSVMPLVELGSAPNPFSVSLLFRGCAGRHEWKVPSQQPDHQHQLSLLTEPSNHKGKMNAAPLFLFMYRGYVV